MKEKMYIGKSLEEIEELAVKELGVAKEAGRGADLSELQAIPACTEVPAVYVAPEYRIDTTDRHYGIRASHIRLLL